jgi:hypothetical protein
LRSPPDERNYRKLSAWSFWSCRRNFGCSVSWSFSGCCSVEVLRPRCLASAVIATNPVALIVYLELAAIFLGEFSAFSGLLN